MDDHVMSSFSESLAKVSTFVFKSAEFELEIFT